MTCLPVIERELRAEARRSMNIWLRIGGAAIFVALFVWLYFRYTVEISNRRWVPAIAGDPGGGAFIGLNVFGDLNGWLFGVTWLIGPLLTADCISREQRDGTLGLLFLTPLSSVGIVLGKAMVNLIRGLTLLLCITPVLVVPLMLGGITSRMCLIAFLVNLGALFASMAAGLIATSLVKDWLRAVVWAEVLSLCFAFAFLKLHDSVLRGLRPNVPRVVFNTYGYFTQNARLGFFSRIRDRMAEVNDFVALSEELSQASASQRMVMVYTGAGPMWIRAPMAPGLGMGGASLESQHVFSAKVVCGCSLLVFALGLGLAARAIESSWQERGKPRWQLQYEERLLTPRYWQQVLSARMKASLDHNPIGWLHHYSTGARLVKWLWALVILVSESVLAADPNATDVRAGQPWLCGFLLLGLSFAAVSSFRRERETGAMELLLVTPLSVRQIMLGRVRGVWSQFLPAFLTFVACLVYIIFGWNWARFSRFGGKLVSIEHFLLEVALGGFFALPIIGMYFSLRRINLVMAWFGAFFCGLIVPQLLIWIGLRLFTVLVYLKLESYLLLLNSLLISIVFWFLLERDLRSRRFLTQSGAGG